MHPSECPNDPTACMCADCDRKREHVLVIERGDRDDLFHSRIDFGDDHHLALTYRHGLVMLVLTRQSVVMRAIPLDSASVVEYLQATSFVPLSKERIARAVELLRVEWDKDWARYTSGQRADNESTEPIK